MKLPQSQIVLYELRFSRTSRKTLAYFKSNLDRWAPPLVTFRIFLCHDLREFYIFPHGQSCSAQKGHLTFFVQFHVTYGL